MTTTDSRTPAHATMPSGAMWEQLFQRSAKPGLSLQGQIREMFVDAILTGVLTPGDPVPSSRELARHLSVGRITVVLDDIEAMTQSRTETILALSRSKPPFDKLGTHVEVTSRLNHGSTFSFALPLVSPNLGTGTRSSDT